MTTTLPDDIKEAIGFLAETLEVTLAMAQEAAGEPRDVVLDDIEFALAAHLNTLREAGYLPALPGGLVEDPVVVTPGLQEAIARLSSTSSEAPHRNDLAPCELDEAAEVKA